MQIGVDRFRVPEVLFNPVRAGAPIDVPRPYARAVHSLPTLAFFMLGNAGTAVDLYR